MKNNLHFTPPLTQKSDIHKKKINFFSKKNHRPQIEGIRLLSVVFCAE